MVKIKKHDLSNYNKAYIFTFYWYIEYFSHVSTIKSYSIVWPTFTLTAHIDKGDLIVNQCLEVEESGVLHFLWWPLINSSVL